MRERGCFAGGRGCTDSKVSERKVSRDPSEAKEMGRGGN